MMMTKLVGALVVLAALVNVSSSMPVQSAVEDVQSARADLEAMVNNENLVTEEMHEATAINEGMTQYEVERHGGQDHSVPELEADGKVERRANEALSHEKAQQANAMDALAEIKQASSELKGMASTPGMLVKGVDKALGEGDGPRGRDGHEDSDPANKHHHKLGDADGPRGRDGHENNDPANKHHHKPDHKLGDTNGPQGRDGHEMASLPGFASNNPGNKHVVTDRLARAEANLDEVARTLEAGTKGHHTEQRLAHMVNEAAQVQKDDQLFNIVREKAIQRAAFDPHFLKVELGEGDNPQAHQVASLPGRAISDYHQLEQQVDESKEALKAEHTRHDEVSNLEKDFQATEAQVVTAQKADQKEIKQLLGKLG